MKIYLTRHGQVCPKDFEGSVDYPTGDIPLSDKGKKQAQFLGEELKKQNFSGVIISSPYRRTMMTASIAESVCHAPIYPNGALREMFFSDEAGNAFVGMTQEQLMQLFPSIAQDASLPYPWWTTYKDELNGIMDRLEIFWDAVLDSEFNEVLAVCHGASCVGSMNYFNQKYSLGLPQTPEGVGDYMANINLNCNLSCIEINKDKEIISARLFATDHLPDAFLTSNTNPKDRPKEIIL